jgi:hypothetical protein
VPVTVVPETPEVGFPGCLIELVIGSVSVRLTGTVDATTLRRIFEVIGAWQDHAAARG